MTGAGEEADREESRRLLNLLATLPGDDPRRQPARDHLVTLHLPLVEHLARRFRNRGEPYDDLVQVGTIGLLKAIDRYDPSRGVEFSTFATPTIAGEIKRWFRDKGWAVRVPRRLQELRLAINSATATLTQDLGRSPTVAELAAHIGTTDEEILEGLESATAYSTISLDVPEAGDDGPAALDLIGDDDAGIAEVENRETLRPLLRQLSARERRIIMLRFFAGMTQSQIAAEVGISQMHVSRLLSQTLAKLRTDMLAE